MRSEAVSVDRRDAGQEGDKFAPKAVPVKESPAKTLVRRLADNAKKDVKNHFVPLHGWRLWAYRLSAFTLYGGLCLSMGFASAGGLSQFLPFDTTTGLLLFVLSVALWTALYGDSMMTYWRALFTPGTLARDHAAFRKALGPYLVYLHEWAEDHPDWELESTVPVTAEVEVDAGFDKDDGEVEDERESGQFGGVDVLPVAGQVVVGVSLSDDQADDTLHPLGLKAFVERTSREERNGLTKDQERRLRRWVDVLVGVPNAVFANATGTFFGLMGVFVVFAHGGALSLPVACFAAFMGYFCGLFAAWTLTRQSIGDNSVRYLPTLWRGVRGLFPRLNIRTRRGYRRVVGVELQVSRREAIKRGLVRGLTVVVAFGLAGFNFVAGYSFLSNLASVKAFTSHVPALQQLGHAPAMVNMGLAVVAGLLTVYAACTFFNFMLDQQVDLKKPLLGQARAYLNKVAQSSLEQIKLLLVGTVTVLFTYMLVLDLGFAASSPLLQLTGSAVFAHAFALISAPCIFFLLGMMMKTGGDLLFRPWTEPQAVAELLALKVPPSDGLESSLQRQNSALPPQRRASEGAESRADVVEEVVAL